MVNQNFRGYKWNDIFIYCKLLFVVYFVTTNRKNTYVKNVLFLHEKILIHHRYKSIHFVTEVSFFSNDEGCLWKPNSLNFWRATFSKKSWKKCYFKAISEMILIRIYIKLQVKKTREITCWNFSKSGENLGKTNYGQN